MQAPAEGALRRTSGALAVDGDVDQAGHLAQLGHPPSEPIGERIRVELDEDALEGVVARDAVGQR
jgi:hypothetical protein